MALTAGTRLGPYEILSPLGAGGMGEVYRARDTRLDRIVAVKVVLAHVAASTEFRERFDREAKAISALDHPHICTLYDVGHDASFDFLVMQYLEGETLADRLARASRPASDPGRPAAGSDASASALSTVSRGPVPLEAALRYAAEIASALDAAHRRGIVHRDLKPGNVMLTKSGTKLLDFGLAKLAGQAPVAGFGDGATRAAPLTGQGALLGTLHYMSPEQLEGREVDARSDIFAFGALLFELLSGRRAFDGQSHASVIAAILNTDPPPLGDFTDVTIRLPLVAHRALDRLLRKCLAKSPDERWQSAADLSDELRWINDERLRPAEPADAPLAGAPAALPASRTRERAWMAATVVSVLGAIALGVWLYPRPVPPPERIQFEIDAPEGTSFAPGPGLVAVSPDGTRIAFVTGPANEDGTLWIRPLASLTAMAVPGAAGAWQPAWSPDGRSLVAGGSSAANTSPLRKFSLAGGPSLKLAENVRERAAWSPAGVILFTDRDGRLSRVPEAGGSAVPVTELDAARGEASHAWPTFLPDGRRFVYSARSREPDKSTLYLASIDTPGRTRLVDVNSCVDYVPGYLVYQRNGTLMAHPFDEKNGRLTGDAIPIVENVQTNVSNGRAAFSVSPSGVLVYRAAQVGRIQDSTLTWFDRGGKTLGTVGAGGAYDQIRLSPDRRLLAVSQVDAAQHSDLWIIDMDRGVPSRFTSSGDTADPVWSTDGATIVYAALRSGRRNLYQRASGGATPERVLYESPEDKTPTGFSPDGKLVLFSAGERTGGRARQLWALPMTGEPKPFPVFPGSSTSDTSAVFSPDGRWIAYASSEGARDTHGIYVQPFPPNGDRVRMSTGTGWSPLWAADGKRIVYVSDEGDYMSVDITLSGGALRPGLPRKMFTVPRSGSARNQFVVDGTGERFLVPVSSKPAAGPTDTPLTVIVNWMSGLTRK